MPTLPSDAVLKALRVFGLSYPGAHTKSPWPDHLDLAVDDKTFAYLSVEGEPLSISCKLPETNETALLMPFAAPTAYGLGNSGWVTAKFPAEDMPPLDVLKVWLDESYRAQAPKRHLATLAAHGGIAAKLAAEVDADKPAKSVKAKKASPAEVNGKKASEKVAAPKRAPAKTAVSKPVVAKPAAAPVTAKKAGKPAKSASKSTVASKPHTLKAIKGGKAAPANNKRKPTKRG
ncbi:MAG: MmcQ/YjbR family DNA-binding protein [Polyangiales bacterium]